MVLIRNKQKDIRKFFDKKNGKDIYVTPGQVVETNSPPVLGDIWEIINSINDEPKIESNINTKKHRKYK